MTGGSISNATAIIGHGNELSNRLGTCTGNINVNAAGQFTLLANASVAQTHAIIGFANPTGGSAVTFNVGTVQNPSPITVKSTSGQILITAGQGSNASIGYYNESVPMSPLVNVLVPQITVETSQFSNPNIILQAGDKNGTSAGLATIGTLASNTVNTTESNISITTGSLQLRGPASGSQDGAARIVNNLPNKNADFNIIIDCNSALLLGGEGATTGFADIYTSRHCTMTVQTSLDINNDPTLQNGYAHIVGYQDIKINESTTGNTVTLKGGDNFGADALIQSINGVVHIGNIIRGAQNVLIGASVSKAPSRILAANDDILLNISQDITLQAGVEDNVIAQIKNVTANINITVGQDLLLFGGQSTTQGITNASSQIENTSGKITGHIGRDLTLTAQGSTLIANDTFCFTEIASLTGDITFQNIGRNVTLTGGPVPNSYAQIGKGDLATASVSQIASNISFDFVLGNIALNAGSGTDCYVQIGQSPFNGTGDVNSGGGDITFTSISGTVDLNGGSNTNTTAIIGHGNELSTRLQTSSGDATLSALGDITLTPGTGTRTHAIIGYHNPETNPGRIFTVTSNTISVTTQASTVHLIGGNQNNAVIGYYNSPTNQTVTVTLGSVRVMTSAGTQGIIRLDAGNDNGSQAGVAAIGSLVGTGAVGNTASSDITITCGTLNLFGPTGTNNGSARVINVRHSNVVTSNVSISADGVNVIGGTSTVPGFSDIYSGNKLTMTAIDNIDINNDKRVTPTPPLQTGNATVSANQDITINQFQSSTADITLVGGSTAGVQTEILSNTGTINIGNGPFDSAIRGAKNIIVGRADMNGYTRISSLAKNLVIYASGNLTMLGGSNAVAITELNALINNTVNMRGLDNLGQPQGTITMTSGSVPSSNARILASQAILEVNCAKDMTLSGGIGVGASIAFIQNLGTGGSTAKLTLINADGNTILNENSLFQHDGNSLMVADAGGSMTLNSDAFIRNAGDALFMVIGTDLTMNNTSVIENTANGLFRAQAGNNVILNNTAQIENAGSGPLHLFAGVNLQLNNTTQILTAAGDINLIADNNFPFPPHIGPGRFVKATGVGIISSGSGDVRIYTAMRPQNTVVGLINGTTYSAGPEFIDTATEHWQTYYPSTFGGVPFTIFYKNPTHIPPNIIIPVEVALGEQNLQTFDDFLFAQDTDFVEFAASTADAAEGDVISKANLNMLRRITRNYQTKKLLMPMKIQLN